MSKKQEETLMRSTRPRNQDKQGKKGAEKGTERPPKEGCRLSGL